MKFSFELYFVLQEFLWILFCINILCFGEALFSYPSLVFSMQSTFLFLDTLQITDLCLVSALSLFLQGQFLLTTFSLVYRLYFCISLYIAYFHLFKTGHLINNISMWESNSPHFGLGL